MEKTNRTRIPLQHDTPWQISDTDSTMKMHITGPKEDRLNKSIITLLSGQHYLQRQSLDMMGNMTR